MEGNITFLAYDAHAYCSLDGAQAGNDSDRFDFNGSEGAKIRLVAKGTSGFVSPRVELRDPMGVVLHDGVCFPSCEPPAFNVVASSTLPATGTYTLTVSDVGFNNTGNYEIYLGCIEGPCFEALPLPLDTSMYSDISAFGIDVDYFEFDAVANTELRLIAKGTSGFVSPRVEIRDPGGTLLHAGGCFPSCEASTFNEVPSPAMPVSGTYSVLLSESGQDNSGNYELYLGCLRGSCFDSQMLSYDASVYDSIAAFGIDLDYFSFSGTAGDQVRFIAKGTSGFVSPRVEIRGPGGQLLHAGGCFPGCEAATFNLVSSASLPTSGLYTVAISEAGQDNSGNYELHLGCLAGACFSSTGLLYDESHYDSIDAFGIDMDYFSFNGTAGDQIRFIAKGTSGFVSPRVEIRDPNGQLLHAGPCFPGCEPSSFNVTASPSLAATGVYTVTITEAGQDNSGNYELHLACLTGSCFDSESLIYDESVHDSIAAFGIDLDFFDFQGTAGDEVRIIAKGTSGFVSPRLEIRDPNDQLLHSGDCLPGCEPSTFNIVPSQTLLLNGTYTIAVREGGQDNSGNYELHLGCPRGVCFAAIDLTYGQTVNNSIDAFGLDIDYFEFDGVQGTEIRVLARGTSGFVSPFVEIRAPNGSLLHAGTCSDGCETSDFNVSPSPNLPFDGRYSLLISENGQDNSGNYSLSLFCLFGACP